MRTQNDELTSNHKELEHVLENKRIEIGYIGKFLGKGDAARNNITAVIISALTLSGILVSLIRFQDSLEYWKIILPIITLGFGYLWGKGFQKQE